MIRRAFPLVVFGVLMLPVLAAQTPVQTPPAAQSAQEDPWPPAGVLRAGPGVQHPEIAKEVKPGYTADAMRARIEGTVEVEAIIGADGKVGEVRVVRSLDKEHGLDDQAVKAVKQWEFKPARKDGVAVPVLVNIELSFAIRKR